MSDDKKDPDDAVSATSRRPARREELNSKVMMATLAVIVWVFSTKFVFGLVYVSLIAEGLIFLIPPLAQRIYKAVPFLRWLGEYELTYRIHMGFVFALATFLTVAWVWEKVLSTWLYNDYGSESLAAHLQRRQEFLFWVMAIIAITADGILFYISLCVSGWGSSGFSFSALLATAIYIVVLLFITTTTIELRRKVERAKKEALL